MKLSWSWIYCVVAVWVGFLLAGISVGKAGDWPQWRGPTGVGYTDEADLPLTWDGKTGENVLWKVSLEGTTGHSSPIVWGNRVFITTAVKQTSRERLDAPCPALRFGLADDCGMGIGDAVWRFVVRPDAPYGLAAVAKHYCPLPTQ